MKTRVVEKHVGILDNGDETYSVVLHSDAYGVLQVCTGAFPYCEMIKKHTVNVLMDICEEFKGEGG